MRFYQASIHVELGLYLSYLHPQYLYRIRFQSEIESYKYIEEEDKVDTIQVQDVLMLDRISI